MTPTASIDRELRGLTVTWRAAILVEDRQAEADAMARMNQLLGLRSMLGRRPEPSHL